MSSVECMCVVGKPLKIHRLSSRRRSLANASAASSDPTDSEPIHLDDPLRQGNTRELYVDVDLDLYLDSGSWLWLRQRTPWSTSEEAPGLGSSGKSQDELEKSSLATP